MMKRFYFRFTHRINTHAQSTSNTVHRSLSVNSLLQ